MENWGLEGDFLMDIVYSFQCSLVSSHWSRKQPLRQRSPHCCPGNVVTAPEHWIEAQGKVSLKEKAHHNTQCVITPGWKVANFYVWVKCIINNQQVFSAHTSPLTLCYWITMCHCNSSRSLGFHCHSEMQYININSSVYLIFSEGEYICRFSSIWN